MTIECCQPWGQPGDCKHQQTFFWFGLIRTEVPQAHCCMLNNAHDGPHICGCGSILAIQKRDDLMAALESDKESEAMGYDGT